MRVLVVNYEYPPLGGGTGIANKYLLKEFSKKKDLYVDVLTSSVAKYRVDKISSKIRVIKLDIGKRHKNLHHQSYLDLLSFFWHSTWWTLKHKENYDLIHAFSGLPGSLTAWLSGKSYLVSLRGADEPGYEPRHKFLWKIIKPAMGYIYGRAQSLDANSQYLKRLVLRSWPDLKIKVIRNGVDTSKFYPAKKSVTQPIILSTSRLGERKGIEYLIEAIAQIPRVELWLAGSGTMKQQLKQLVKKLRLGRRVKFLGPVPHQKLPALCRRAKVFALPSLSESSSNSLLEALACGLPVVATKVGGNGELVNKQNGILVSPASSQALAKAMVESLNRQWTRSNAGKQYSWGKTAKQYLKLYFGE